jgi:hypothetical protein
MTVIVAPEATLPQPKIPPYNLNRLPIDQGIGKFLSSRFQYAVKRWPRNVHQPSTLLLLQSIQIPEADGLGLLNRQAYLLQHTRRDAHGLEESNAGELSHTAQLHWPRHA